MSDLLLVAGKGGRQAAAAFATSTQFVFTGTSGKRTGVYITAYAAPVYLKIANSADANPTVSTTDYDFEIPANTTGLFPWKASIAVWGLTTDKASGVEVYG